MHENDIFIFDCDGTIWLGEETLSGALEFLEKLEKLGKKIYFYTNNCMTTRSKYVEKMKRFGLNVNINQVLIYQNKNYFLFYFRYFVHPISQSNIFNG